LNEDDIVEAFVRHHATMVDHHLFLDNGSVDQTLEILHALQGEGFNLTVLQNRTPFFTEVSYNTALFRHARAEFSADWVLFLDTDEFIDDRQVADGIRPLLSAFGNDVTCLGLPSRTYFDLPGDDSSEPIVPIRMRTREPVGASPDLKVVARGELAEAGVIIDAGQHQLLFNDETLFQFTDHGLILGHYYRRSAWQQISKSVMGYLKVAAAGQREQSRGRSAHYNSLFETLRDAPERFFTPAFLEPSYANHDLVEDPLPYRGSPLRYTQPADPKFKALRVLIAYAEQLAEGHGAFIDGSVDARLKAEHDALQWTFLF
jgi:Glycosyl transferase family 2